MAAARRSGRRGRALREGLNKSTDHAAERWWINGG